MNKRDLKMLKEKILISSIDMNKKNLKELTKAQLIRLLLMQQAQKPSNSVNKAIPAPRTKIRKPIPKPQKSVKQMVNEYEDIIQPPQQFRDGYKPIPKPRTDRPLQMQNAPRSPKPKRPPPPPPIKEHEGSILPHLQFKNGEEPTSITDRSSSKIKELSQALKGHAKLYEVEIQDNLNTLNHFTKTKEVVELQLKDLLKTMKGYKFIETLEVTFKKKELNPETGKSEFMYKTAFFIGKAKTITKASDIESELSMSQQEIVNTIDIWVSEDLGWVIDKIDSNYINIVT